MMDASSNGTKFLIRNDHARRLCGLALSVSSSLNMKKSYLLLHQANPLALSHIHHAVDSIPCVKHTVSFISPLYSSLNFPSLSYSSLFFPVCKELSRHLVSVDSFSLRPASLASLSLSFAKDRMAILHLIKALSLQLGSPNMMRLPQTQSTSVRSSLRDVRPTVFVYCVIFAGIKAETEDAISPTIYISPELHTYRKPLGRYSTLHLPTSDPLP